MNVYRGRRVFVTGGTGLMGRPLVEMLLDAGLRVPDTTKFTVHTGWKPEMSIETTMRDLIDYCCERIRREGDRCLVR